MTLFSDFDLPQSLTTALQRMNYAEPTPIQAAAIPVALGGRDILGSAQTGTGKTAAFSIPLAAYILKNPGAKALVMTPTRELAVQVIAVIHQLMQNNKEVKTALLIGGESMGKQLGQLKNNPRIIVGTPGRINDHLNRRTLRLDNASFLVLDETDRMLDMGFGVQLDAIAEYLPEDRQTLMFSATLPKAIVRVSDKYLTNPERVSMGESNLAAANLKQETIFLQESEKYDRLLQELDAREGSVIVFVKTKHGADKMADRLSARNHQADAIHGDLRQNQRDRAIRDFRNNRYRILVATDVAARGLDIPHIRHVINYDLPQCAEDYIHRIGRTARAGAEGEALCLISPQDSLKWRAIRRLMDPNGARDDEREPRRSGKPSGSKSYGNKVSYGKPQGGQRREFGSRERFDDAPRRDSRERFEDAPRRESAGRDRFGDAPRSAAPRGNRFEDSPRPRQGDGFRQDAPRSRDRDEGFRKAAPQKQWSPVGFNDGLEEQGDRRPTERKLSLRQDERPRRRDDREERAPRGEKSFESRSYDAPRRSDERGFEGRDRKEGKPAYGKSESRDGKPAFKGGFKSSKPQQGGQGRFKKAAPRRAA